MTRSVVMSNTGYLVRTSLMKRPGRLGGEGGKDRVRGPIADLESNLRADWWKTLFSATYLKTDGDVVESADITACEVDAFVKALALEPKDRILDLCCGP